jgi:two-component system, OmpR family, alkaline phosphatase synthesis response regulator PhoP
MANRKKILLIDDSKTAIFMEKILLKGEAYDLLVAGDGAEGVATAAAEQPDLILMDMVMPRMTGPEAVAALRAREDTREIPIIMVTTRGEEDAVAMAVENGCNDYLTKPIDGPLLLAKVRDYLRQ